MRTIITGVLMLLSTGIRAQEKPNVLLVMVDQMTPFLTGTYGHDVVQTPNLDKLAAEGVLFEQCYSPNPICAPARASMLTGKYSSRIGVYDNAAELPAGEPTMAHYFSYAGYETVLSGKMHFVGPDQWHGFEQRYVPNIYPPDFTWAKERFDKAPRSHGRSYQGASIRIVPEDVDLMKDRKGNLRIRPASVEDLYSLGEVKAGFNESSHNARFDRVSHTMALEYLESAAKNRSGEARPFFLCVSYNYPHEPFHPPKEMWDLYEGTEIELPSFPSNLEETWSAMDRWLNRHHGLETHEVKDEESLRRVYRAYYALVSYTDLMLGELMDELESSGLDENTIVVFTSDHGEMLGMKGMVQKRAFYEWSSRVPLVFRIPDRSNAGRRIKEPVNLIDILPTLLEMTGIEHEAAMFIDGESLVPYMDGSRKRTRPVYSEMPSEGVFAPCFMVRSGKMKYNYFHGYGAQLFDMEADPEEWKNLSGVFGYFQVESELKALIMDVFDPQAIEKRINESMPSRLLIRSVMERQEIDWSYQPAR